MAITGTAKLVDESGAVWADLSDFAQEGDWLLARWRPISVPPKALELLTKYEAAVANQEFALTDDFEDALREWKVFVAAEDGSCFPVTEIQKGADGIALKR